MLAEGRLGGPNQIVVSAPIETTITDSTLAGTFTVAAGARVGFAVQWAPPEGRAPEPFTPGRVAERLEDTIEGWRSWEAEHDIYEGPHRDLVRLNSRVLKGLTYRPTGAIVAAPTTSLPETVGGERNWVALDRAIALAPQLGRHARLERWTAECAEIRDAVLTRGWSDARQAYAQSFASDELDAAQLLMPILEFLPATDERIRSTIDAIADQLTEDGLVLRYRNEEGLNADMPAPAARCRLPRRAGVGS
jgi:GH15 family glucan-1,4-alpha-glucosidase